MAAKTDSKSAGNLLTRIRVYQNLTPIVLIILICDARHDSGKSSPIVLEIIYPQSPPIYVSAAAKKTSENRHVRTLSYVVVISKRNHQIVADRGVLLEAESVLLHTLAPPVVGKARRDHVERNAIRTLLQRGKQFRDFDIGSRPAVDE